MLTIQSVMLVLLGFLGATLLVLLLAPAYWYRAVRLTTRQIKQSMPLTEAEIAADKDRLRAEYAIKVHRLEAKAEQSSLASARQQIELNRRDAAISQLEGEIARLQTAVEEHENARRVLEQTITDRVPQLEQRLTESRKLLIQRDRDLAQVTDTAGRQSRALDEATQLNTQQRNEVLRLNSSLAAISARTRESLSDPKFDAEVALRTEIELLKSKVREQAGVIARLQPGGAPVVVDDSLPAPAEIAAARNLGEPAALHAMRAELEMQVRDARAKIEDQAVEISKLKAALAAYERGSEERSLSLKDSRLAMKVRLGSLQAECEKQAEAIQRMRGELAAANEKLARQASHFMAEMRRLGTGAGVMPAAARAAGNEQRVEVASRPTGSALAIAKLASSARRFGAEGVASLGALANGTKATAEAGDQSRVRGFLKALGGAAAVKAAESAAGAGSVDLDEPGAPAKDDAAAGGPPRRLAERLANARKN